MGIYKLKCNKCDGYREFKNKNSYQSAIYRNRKMCKSCTQKERFKDKTNHPMWGKFGKEHNKYGKVATDEFKKNRSEYMKSNNPMDNLKSVKKIWETRRKNGTDNGYKFSKEVCDNIGNGHRGLTRSTESKLKSRLSAIKRIERNKFNGGQMIPNYNPSSIPIIEQVGEENGYNFQHAENGGEYHIKELGYWVDGYDKEKNVIIEYYENYHKKQSDKDKRRKQEIIDLLGCKFIELKEWEI
jgi:hypothetical protein